jgi:hypothetical protein
MCGFYAVAALLLLIAALRAHGSVQNDPLFARLGVHARSAEMPDEQARKIIGTALAERDADTDDEALLIEVLVLMSPEFRSALDAYDEEDYAACVAALKPLHDAKDPFVRYNARSYAAKALVHMDRLVEAQERIEALLDVARGLAMHSLDEPELVYMLGYCQVQNLEHAAAQATLEGFLRDFPDASPRFVVTAKQMLAELARRIPESMGEVADLMGFSEKRLAASDPSERTQTVQDRVVELLDKLIEEVENQEQQASSSSNQSQRSRQRSQQQPQPQSPMDKSQLPPGSPQDGTKRPGRVVDPGDAWGAMPAAEREKVLQVLRDRFPGRYRALVEQYYESLAEQP